MASIFLKLLKNLLIDKKYLENSLFFKQFMGLLDELDVTRELQFHPEIREYLILTDTGIFFKLNYIYENSGLKNEDQSEIALQQKKRLIHLWEDQWLTRNEIIRSRIKSLFGKSDRIHGRETQVGEITNNELVGFLENNHLAVAIKGKYRFCLEYKGKVASIISLSAPKKFIRNEKEIYSYEILRFCHLKEVTVVGGLTKLVSHFINLHLPGHLMTYIDAEWGDGQGFKKAGFKTIGKLPHQTFLVESHTMNRYHPTYQNKIIQQLKNPPGHIGLTTIHNAGSIKMVRELVY